MSGVTTRKAALEPQHTSARRCISFRSRRQAPNSGYGRDIFAAVEPRVAANGSLGQLARRSPIRTTFGEVGVPTLEVMARRAGLLGEHQRITHAKLFRAAKKTLGIRSRRAGFGARSQWLWKLPRRNTTSLKPEPGPEQRATPEPRVPIPTLFRCNGWRRE